MQYHAASLADSGSDIDLIGLEGAAVSPAIASHPRIRVHRLPDRAFAGRNKGGVRRFVYGSALRGLSQARRLLATLLCMDPPDVILVQNPPAFPALSVAWLVARLRGARLVIDWHNLSHTIAAVKLGDGHRAVKAIARSERRWAARADAHLAVSAALAEWLRREYRVTANVVYDRPSSAFERPSQGQASALWDMLAKDAHLSTRPPLVVCPTGWTRDEDFDLLLEALERAERQLMKDPGVTTPVLAVLLTGRGALRDTFEARVARRAFTAIAIRTLWLEPADYPTLVGMADLGLCLHQSSSGLDLPMKLADLGGAGVPVAVYDYAPVLGEVMTDGQHGVRFRDPGELAVLLVQMARRSMPADAPLERSRRWLAGHPPERWHAQWNSSARGALLDEKSSGA